MKIAVCLSGQPRTIEHAIPNILSYFSGNHTYDFFCQSWDYNTYKRLNKDVAEHEQPIYWDQEEKVDTNWIINQLLRLSPKKIAIQGKHQLKEPMHWDSLLYSFMYANHMKRMYEIENDFRYDCVVKTRYDLIFRPGDRFLEGEFKFTYPHDRKSRFDGKIETNYLEVFTTHNNRMRYEFNRVNTSDCFFYGTSSAMDIITDVYRYRYRKERVLRADDWDPIGPGVAINDMAVELGMRTHHTSYEETFYRKECLPLDSIDDYHKIREISMEFFKL